MEITYIDSEGRALKDFKKKKFDLKKQLIQTNQYLVS